MVGVRVCQHYPVDPRHTRIEKLLAQIWGSIDKYDYSAEFYQHRHSAAAIAGIVGIAAAPISPDYRHAGRGAAAQDRYPHWTGALALPKRRKKLALVTSAKYCSSIPFNSATAAAVAAMKAGSLRLPR